MCDGWAVGNHPAGHRWSRLMRGLRRGMSCREPAALARPEMCGVHVDRAPARWPSLGQNQGYMLAEGLHGLGPQLRQSL